MAVNPRKIGLRLEPLCLILLYDFGDGGKLRKRYMPLRSIKSTSDPRAKAEELKIRHLKHLERVPLVVLIKLISIVREIDNGQLTVSQAAERVSRQFSVDTERDLNVASDTELRRQKDLMEVSFIEHAILPGHPDYVYDKKVVFNQPSDALSAWDEDDWFTSKKLFSNYYFSAFHFYFQINLLFQADEKPRHVTKKKT